MSHLPSPFRFSQSSLQDYAECPRRFQLRYIEHLSWPAAETEPVQAYEEHQQEGSLFHRLVQQHLLGIPAKKLTPLAKSENLARWWDAYLQIAKHIQNAKKLYPEHSLSTPIGKHRLVAKYDLITVENNGKITVYDWKTYRKRPSNENLAIRWQTRLYPFVLKQAGNPLKNGKPILAEDITMIYWFSNYPEDPAKFAYNAAIFQRDWDLIEKTVTEIETASEFPKCKDAGPCKFCPYRSYCNRGVTAGNRDRFEVKEKDETEFSLDLEQIAEIAF